MRPWIACEPAQCITQVYSDWLIVAPDTAPPIALATRHEDSPMACQGKWPSSLAPRLLASASMRMPADNVATALGYGQGLYYLVTGIWPLLSMRTFEAVTGPKADKWLVKTVGVLVGVVGAVLMLSARRRHVAPEPALLAAGSAAYVAAVANNAATPASAMRRRTFTAGRAEPAGAACGRPRTRR